MSGFLKRDTKTVNPAGGVNPAQAPNVGQFGWTSFDANNVNQIIEYVNICKDYAQQAKDSAAYVELRFTELQEFMNFIEIVYSELKPIIDQIQPIYQDIMVRHEDIITRHIDVIRLHNLVTQDKIDINQIKAEAVTDTLKIKADAIAETNAIKAAAVAETTAIKVEATGEANRAKGEADRAKAEADRSGSSAVDSAKSATLSGTEAGKSAASAKEAAEIAEELRKGQVYRGTWNIEANKAYPPKPDTNSVWDITLNEGSTEYQFDGKRWYWGDRLLYLKDDNKYSQIESGAGVLSVNGKTGAVTLNAADVGAIDKAGDTLTQGNLAFATNARLQLNNTVVMGAHNNALIRDHGNGNVTISASKTSTGTAGTLYLGYNGSLANTEGYNTRDVRLDSPMTWKSAHNLVSAEGLLNSERLAGPIRTEVTANNVWHTTVGGTDTVNRGRTLIAAGEAGKQIADNTNSESEGVHIAGDQTDGVYIHTGVQTGWAGSTHQRYQFRDGDIYSQAMSGSTVNRFYHTGHKPTPAAINAVNKVGDNEVGSLALARGKILDATLTHRSGYLSVYPYGSSYGLDGVSGNRCRMYYKEHNNGKPEDLSRGLVFSSVDQDGTNHPMNMWLGGDKVYHQGFKPTTADIGALSKSGDTMAGELQLSMTGIGLSYPANAGSAARGITWRTASGANQLQAGGVWDGRGNLANSYYIGVGATPWNGNADTWFRALPKGELYADNKNRVYHEGFKPTLNDVIGVDNSTQKHYTFNKPNGAVDGKFYPILLNGTNAYPDVFIQTTSSGSSHSMNHCAFRGIVRSGGWSDRGRAVSGEFIIYDVNERAIHSIVGGTESDNHYVIYVEARAFPLSVYTDSNVAVSCTGQDTLFGTTTYKAGISGMTASGDYGTKTSLLMSFDRGNGQYGYNIKANYLSIRDSITSGQRVFVENYNEVGSFITRRPGTTAYAMMGQSSQSTGDALIGTSTGTAAYTSFLRVSPTTLAYSNNGSSESRVYHEGFKPSLGELGGIASSGGTMTGTLTVPFNNGLRTDSQSGYTHHASISAESGYAMLWKRNGSSTKADEFIGINNASQLTFRQDKGAGDRTYSDHRVYHSGSKPTAADVGAIPTSGGRINGALEIHNASSHLKFVETDSASKQWHIEGNSGNLAIVETGAASRATFKAGGGVSLSGQLDVAGHTVLSSGSILKFMTPSYSAGAQIYARDGGQYGAQLVVNPGGSLILGSGESGNALADVVGTGASTEHNYIASDADVYVMPNCNTIADRKTHIFGADGNVSFNSGNTVARTYYGGTTSYIARNGANMYLASNADNGRVYIEGKISPVARVGGTDYTIYHSGNLPTFGDLSIGKAIGSSQQLGGTVDLDDFKTPGVYHQPGNAGATSGMNYPEKLAGSLLVYTAAGVIQEYRIYNSSKLYTRAQYGSGGWTTWTLNYNAQNKPTAADVGAYQDRTRIPIDNGAVGISRGWVNGADDTMPGGRYTGNTLAFAGTANHTSQFLMGSGDLQFRTAWGSATTGWNKVYHSGYKPTAADVAAVSKTGDTMTGDLKVHKAKASIILRPSGDDLAENYGRLKFEHNTGDQHVHILHSVHDAHRAPFGLRVQKGEGNNTASHKAWLEAEGEIYADGDKRVYHAGFKPTAADVGALPVSGDVIIGSANNGLTKFREVISPGGGQYRTSTSTVDGALKITLPVSWTSTMLSFWVDVFQYATGKTTTFFISGYNYSTNSSWSSNPSVVQIGGLVEYNVRFGHDGTKCAIYIGETNEKWNYPQVTVRNFQFGYSDTSIDRWNSGWKVEFSTTLGTITATVKNRVYSSSNKPTAADVGALPLNGGTAMTGNISTPNVKFTGSDGGIYDAEGALVVQTTKNFGANLFGSDQKSTYLVHKEHLYARKGVTDYKIYHQGFKPTAADVGAIATTEVNGDSKWSAIINKIPRVSGAGVIELGRYVDFHKENSTADYDLRLDTGTGVLNIMNPNGAIQVGAQNGSYAHIYTDRPEFYMNKQLNTVNLKTRVSGAGSAVHNTGLITGGSSAIVRSEIQGGAYAAWRDRAAGLLVDCPLSEGSAHMIWKATHWGKYHIAGMDAHVPGGDIARAQVALHVGGTGSSTYTFNADGTVAGTGWTMSANGPVCNRTGNLIDWSIASFKTKVPAWQDIGDVAFMFQIGSQAAPGAQRAGSQLFYCDAEGKNKYGSPPGTWRCQGQSQGNGNWGPWNATVWVRIA